jgi:3-oxoacyl-[acyl-carrier protein] reductase
LAVKCHFSKIAAHIFLAASAEKSRRALSPQEEIHGTPGAAPDPMNLNLEGKTGVITGASKGIGYAVAESMAAANGNLVLCARHQTEIDEAARRLSEIGSGKKIGVVCDVRHHAEVQKLIATAIEQFDRVDVLINNAGMGRFARMGELTPETWHQIIETNLNGAYYASHEAIPHMVRQGGGWIINIGSLAGKSPFAGGAAYNASKFGLLGFSEAMMLDVRHQGIRVSCIMPGSVETHFNGAAPGASDWKLQPEDIAEMVMDLLGFESRALPSRVEMRPSRPPRKG